ncbi:MAG: hypothetical protein R3F56_21085 [Planctomycetota bacterium]
MNPLAKLVIAAATSSLVAAAPAQSRTLILLQENSGRSSLTEWMEPQLRTAAEAIVDQFVETGEAAKFAQLAQGSYQRFINLSDGLCTRDNLLNNLIQESLAGRVVDLCVLGHGAENLLVLHQRPNLTGSTIEVIGGTFSRVIVHPGTIRSMLTDARARHGSGFQFNLRLVYMCNCYGSTLNDDWLAIGAKVSIGSDKNNYMPEPMLSDFWRRFVKDDHRAGQAAALSYSTSRPFWELLVGTQKVQDSQHVVSGESNLIFRDQCQLAVGQERTFFVPANQIHSLPQVYLVHGKVYRFTASGSWRNGMQWYSPPATGANGYTPGLTDFARRVPANMMCLIGERHARFQSPASHVNGSEFQIGVSATITANGHGFLSLYANDAFVGYSDNVGGMTVTVKRMS